MAKNDILDKIKKLTSGEVAPTPKQPRGKTDKVWKDKAKQVIEGRPKPPSELEKKATEGQSVVTTLSTKIQGVEIASLEQYQKFDGYLSQVIAVRKEWREDWERVASPLRQAKQALDELNRKTDKPREMLEVAIRSAMKQFQLKQLRAREEEERLKEEAAETERQKARDLEVKALTAPTQTLRDRLLGKAHQAEAVAEAIQEVEVTPAPDADNSHAKYPMKWSLVDFEALVAAVAEGAVPLEVLTLDNKVINTHFRNSQEEVAGWPGVKVERNVQIVSGQRWRE